MKSKFFITLFLAGMLAAKAVADDTNAPPPVNDWNSFSSIATSNIFNPSRVPRIRSTYTTTRTPRTDYFTLVGTMTYEKGQYAFFDGNSSSYRKTLNVGQTIAGYKIAEITTDNIKLAASSNQTITLSVGTQMRRPEGGRWRVGGRDEPAPVASAPVSDGTTNSGTNAAPDSAAPAAVTGGSQSDLIKQMMLRRMNEK